MKHQLKHHLATLAALTYLVTALFWSLPEGLPGRHRLVAFLGPAVHFAGLWQSWGMFAPDPTAEDVYVEAHLSRAGAAPVTLNLSHMSVMGYGERYTMERWRKFSNDAVRKHPELLAPAAARLARLVEADSGVPVTGVEIQQALRDAGESDWHVAPIYNDE